MSKGSPIVPVRVPPLFLHLLKQAVIKGNRKRRGAPYTLSSWILTACREKLDHLERSSKKKFVEAPAREAAPMKFDKATGEYVPDLWRQYHAQRAE